MLARTKSSCSFFTTSPRQSHSSNVHGETKSTFSAAVTNLREAMSFMRRAVLNCFPARLKGALLSDASGVRGWNSSRCIERQRALRHSGRPLNAGELSQRDNFYLAHAFVGLG